MATRRALEQVNAQIERIRQIAARWSAEGPIPEVERELLLDKLRALYEEVLFLDEVIENQDVSVTNEPLMQNKRLENETSSVLSGAVSPEASDEDYSKMESVGSAAGDFGVSGTVPGQASIETQSEETASLSDEPMTVVWEQPSVATDPRPSDQKLFSDEPLVRSRVDKQVILSLYGEETSASASRPLTGARQPETQPLMEPVEETALSPSEEPHKPSVEVNFQVNVAETSPVMPRETVPLGGSNGSAPKVLGEMIAPVGESLGERLGRQHPHTDVASRLRASTVTDLRHSIGINDRFLLLNELFGGDTALYDRTIARLNEFTSLDEAMIYIQENFEWNPDSEGATFLVELLERKLEN